MPTPALQAYLEAQFGGSFEVKTKTVSVGLTATKVVDHNWERMGLVLVLLGANKVYLAPDSEPTSTHGIELISSGASISMNAHDDLAMVGHEWYGLADTAPSDVYVLEVLRYQGKP